MKRSKKIFIGMGAFFLVLLLYASYDISQRTSFPGSRHHAPEKGKTNKIPDDSPKQDTVSKTRN